MLYKLKDLIETKVSGEWGSEDIDGSGVNVIRTANFTNLGVVDFSKVVKRKIDEKKVISKRLIKGDVIIEKSGGSPNQPVGRVVFFNPIDEEIYLTNNFTSFLRPNKKIVDPKYFFYLLYDLYRKDVVLKYQNKTTGIINLKLDNYLEEKVNVIEKLSDQIRIAEILSQAESLIAQRKQSISLLDELLKSTFLEMFGDPVRNEKGWEVIQLGKVTTTLTDYHANGSYEILRDNVVLTKNSDYALMVRTTDLEKNDFTKECNYIDEKSYNFLDKSKVYGGEIIINKIGSAGKVYLMPYLNRPTSLGMNSFLLRFNNDANNLYIYNLLTSEFGKNSIAKHIKGAVTKTITKDAIRSIKIPLPPIELQTKFATIVEKVEALKTQYQQSLTELQNMYGVLSQKAFKGELSLDKKKIKEKV